MTTYLDIDPTFGGPFPIIGNKTTGWAHAAHVDADGRRYPFCAGDSEAGRLSGRTVVTTVEGYRGIRDFAADEWKMCPACTSLAAEIIASRERDYAQVQAEGPTAGRRVRFTLSLVVEETVPQDATLYSIKDADEQWRWRLSDLLDEFPQAQVTVEFADESTDHTTDRTIGQEAHA